MGFLLSGHWTHDFDPFLIRFPEWFPLPGIRWYGMAYLAGFVGGWLLLKFLSRRKRLGDVRPDEVGDLVFWSAVGAVIGGRLGYALLYNLSMTLQQPWTLLQVWQGGMASHGGIVGVTLMVTWWYSRRKPDGAELTGSEPGETVQNGKGKKKKAKGAGRDSRKADSLSTWNRLTRAVRSPEFWRLGDGVVSVAPIGLFCGRVANFINGELWGRPSELPWAVIFPPSADGLGGPDFQPRHPSALYEALLEGIVLFLWLFPRAVRGKWKPGSGAVHFIVGYAALRFVVEFFREPDEGVGFQWFHLTRGQWLSVAMAGIGIVLALWIRRTVCNSRNASGSVS